MIVDQDFKGIDYSSVGMDKMSYENCNFIGCNLIQADLSNCTFEDCTFEDCNLSAANLKNTAFRDVRFVNSKLLGLHFEDCNPFALTIYCKKSTLDLSSFYKVNLPNTLFVACSLKEVNFEEAKLNKVVFDACNLQGAIFENTILEKADLRTAYSYLINTETNRLKGAKFSAQGLSGLLAHCGIEIEYVF